VAFPVTPLDVLVELQLAGVWTDVTDDVYLRDRIQIGCGRADWGARVDPSKLTLTFDDRSERYNSRNAESDLFGLIGLNTPIRVSVPDSSSHLELDELRTGYVSTPHVSALNITGDIDIRCEFDADLTNTAISQGILGKWGTVDADRSWILRCYNGTITFNWYDGAATALGGFTSTVNYGGKAMRVTLDVDNGAGGYDLTFYQADSLDGPWEVFTGPLTGVGSTSIQSTTSAVRIGPSDTTTTPQRLPFIGHATRFEVRSVIDGTVVADPDFRAVAAGATSFADAAGLTWTVNSTASIRDRDYRFTGEVKAWKPRRDVSGNDIFTLVEAAGQTRRLGSGEDELQSTLRRRVPTYSPLAYWPMEEGSAATQAASPIDGVAPLQATFFNWASAGSLVSSGPLPVLASGADLPQMRGIIPPPAAAITGWLVRWVYRLDTINTTLYTHMRVLSTGTVADWKLQWRDNLTRIIGLDSDGATVFSTDFTTGTDLYNQWNEVRFAVVQSGGTVDWSVTWQDIGGDAGAVSGSFSGTIGRPTAVASPIDGFSASLDGMAIGHISAWGTSTTSAYVGAITGYAGEYTIDRLMRVAGEELLPLSVVGIRSEMERIGAQRITTILDTFGQATDVDGGILYDRRDRLALRYRCRADLYSQDVALTLDYTTAGHVAPDLEPAEDDQAPFNTITVTRLDGSSAIARQLEGRLSVLSPSEGGMGKVSTSATLNLRDDDQPAQHAAWRVYLATWDESRWPVVAVNMAACPDALRAQVQAVDLGDRMQITNPPASMAPATIDLLAQGYTEVLGAYDWDIVFNSTPAGPWNIWIVEDPDYGRPDTAGSSLATSYTSTATSISVATTTGPVWTTDHSDTPWNISVGGETMTVVGLGTVVNLADDPLLLAGTISGWSGSNSAITYDTTVLNTANGADASIKDVPNGSSASGGVNSAVRSPVASITAGASYTVCGWVYSPLGWSDLRTAVDWYDASNVFISSSLGSATVVPAATWTFLTQTFTAPALASRATTRGRWGSTPAATDISYWWALRIIAAASVSTASPQTMTVARSRNGVSKAQASGEAVTLATSPYAAL
jgi:hypothetical protein